MEHEMWLGTLSRRRSQKEQQKKTIGIAIKALVRLLQNAEQYLIVEIADH